MDDVTKIADRIAVRELGRELEVYGAERADYAGLSQEERQKLLDILKARKHASAHMGVIFKMEKS